MIVRSWRGVTALSQSAAYLEYLHARVLPELRSIPSSRGAYVLRQVSGERAEFLVLSLWESMDAVREFAGPDPERAVIHPQARRFLLEADAEAKHYEVLHAPEPARES